MISLLRSNICHGGLYLVFCFYLLVSTKLRLQCIEIFFRAELQSSENERSIVL